MNSTGSMATKVSSDALMGLRSGSSSESKMPMTSSTTNSLVRMMLGAVMAPSATSKTISKAPLAFRMNNANTVSTRATWTHWRRSALASQVQMEDRRDCSIAGPRAAHGFESREIPGVAAPTRVSGEAIDVGLGVRGTT